MSSPPSVLHSALLRAVVGVSSPEGKSPPGARASGISRQSGKIADCDNGISRREDYPSGQRNMPPEADAVLDVLLRFALDETDFLGDYTTREDILPAAARAVECVIDIYEADGGIVTREQRARLTLRLVAIGEKHFADLAADRHDAELRGDLDEDGNYVRYSNDWRRPRRSMAI